MAKQIIYTSVSMKAQVEEPMCTCLEKAGDDVNCQVHGSTPPSIPPHQESVDGEES